MIAGSLDYAGAALLVARAAGRTGAGLVTLAVPESLQPIFAAKVVEATTMALPEDDVEELDPEPAFARILDHEHDAIVIGPGLRPGLATAELVRRLLDADEPDPAPILLDAEALRSLATMDEWWEGDRRPAVLTPHAGEFARLRAGSGRDPEEDGDLAGDDAARVAAARDAATAGTRWSCSRVRARSSPHRTGRWPSRRSRTRPWPAAGRATSSPAPSGHCWPRGCRRSTQPAWASISTAWPVTRRASGWAMPGSWPRTCPTAWPSPASGWWRSPRGGPAPGAWGSGARAEVDDTRVTPIEDRLAAAGLPPLPRMAWLEIDLGAIGSNLEVLRGLVGSSVPAHPVVKADAYGHGALPVARALVEAGADGLCVATLDEALDLRVGGLGGPIHVLYPIPASGSRRLPPRAVGDDRRPRVGGEPARGRRAAPCRQSRAGDPRRGRDRPGPWWDRPGGPRGGDGAPGCRLGGAPGRAVDPPAGPGGR